MAQPALHFAVGTACTTLITILVGPVRRRWYRLGPLLVMLGGVWACLPDADHLLRRVDWTVAEKVVDFEGRHQRSDVYNIFFFHTWMDRHWGGKGTVVGLVWMVGLLSAFFWLSARRIAKLEKKLSGPDVKNREKGRTW